MKLQIEYVPIDTLVPYEHNAKQHPQEQIDQIKRSITDYGMNDPIGVWHDNVIVEGHGRWIALKQLGYTEVPIIRLDDLTDEQRREYMIVHNQTTMNSGFDIGALEFEFADLTDFDAAFYGFDFGNVAETEPAKDDVSITEQYQIIIDCENEADMEEKYEFLQEACIECRISTL